MSDSSITLSQLESHLWESANILRGPVDAADFKTYIFPLLFFKRICDVWAPRTTPSRQVEALIERRQAHPPNLRLHNLLAISGPKGKDWRQIQPSTLSPDRFSGSGIKVRFGGNGMLFTHPCGSSAWP